MRTPYDVIKKPVLTEKVYDTINDKRYAFEVDINANKTEIKQAVEAIFNVKVEKVNTLRTMGKLKRQGMYMGRRPEVKKAYVILKKDSKPIEFFQGMAQ